MSQSNAHNCLFLTGYMGAGKSTIGRLLATKLGYRFLDTDKALVQRFDKSISKIFSDPELGESAFRKAETALIAELTQKENIVISTGGGTLIRDETFDVAHAHGTIIYLKAPLEELFERVIFSPKDRPMINVPNAEEKFKERFEEREPYYNRSQIIIETGGSRQAEEVADDIIEHLNINKTVKSQEANSS